MVVKGWVGVGGTACVTSGEAPSRCCACRLPGCHARAPRMQGAPGAPAPRQPATVPTAATCIALQSLSLSAGRGWHRQRCGGGAARARGAGRHPPAADHGRRRAVRLRQGGRPPHSPQLRVPWPEAQDGQLCSKPSPRGPSLPDRQGWPGPASRASPPPPPRSDSTPEARILRLPHHTHTRLHLAPPPLTPPPPSKYTHTPSPSSFLPCLAAGDPRPRGVGAADQGAGPPAGGQLCGRRRGDPRRRSADDAGGRRCRQPRPRPPFPPLLRHRGQMLRASHTWPRARGSARGASPAHLGAA